MKLAHIWEALAAPVHRNVDRTLSVISNLVQHGHEIELAVPRSSCMFIQALHSISAVSGIPARVLADQLKIRTPRFDGHTLEEIFKLIHSKRITYNGQKYKFKLGVKTYDGIDEALTAVNNGQPVIAAINIYEALQTGMKNMEYEHPNYRTGVISLKGQNLQYRHHQNLFHTLLLIGYDSGHDHVIFRETRGAYGHGGYAKVSKKMLKKHPELVKKYFAITVEDMKNEAL